MSGSIFCRGLSHFSWHYASVSAAHSGRSRQESYVASKIAYGHEIRFQNLKFYLAAMPGTPSFFEVIQVGPSACPAGSVTGSREHADRDGMLLTYLIQWIMLECTHPSRNHYLSSNELSPP